jgi:N-sulfoglucosamine sulfohydrolase
MQITRRAIMAGLAAAPARRTIAQTSTARPPNILLVLSDDHSAPFVGTYGARWMSTPNLDGFAAQGVRFTRAFTAAPQCVPSRAAFMTGRSPVAVRMGRFSSPLPPDVRTLPEELRTLGYFTGVCGRYFHLNGVIKPGAVTSEIYDKHNLRTWDRRVDFMNVSGQAQTLTQFDQFLTKAPAGKPWFFWINYGDPHHVWDADAGKVDPAKVGLPVHLPDLPGVRSDLAKYCGEVERLDRLFGETMASLKKRGLEENTIVIFMGDNGMAFPHGKGSLYDPGLNVPLMFRWTGKIKPAVTPHLFSGEDLAPTLIQTAGGKAPEAMSGRSHWNLLTGGTYEPRRYIFAARLHHGNAAFTPATKASTFDLSRCVRSANWKLIYNCTPQMEYQPVDSARDPSWQEMITAHKEGKLKPEIDRTYFQTPRPVIELYDLDNDPGELKNLAGAPEVQTVQRELLIALQEKMILDYDFLPPPMGLE